MEGEQKAILVVLIAVAAFALFTIYLDSQSCIANPVIKSTCNAHPLCEANYIWQIHGNGELIYAPCGKQCNCPPNPVPDCYTQYNGKCKTTCNDTESPMTGGNAGCPDNLMCCR